MELADGDGQVGQVVGAQVERLEVREEADGGVELVELVAVDGELLERSQLADVLGGAQVSMLPTYLLT